MHAGEAQLPCARAVSDIKGAEGEPEQEAADLEESPQQAKLKWILLPATNDEASRDTQTERETNELSPLPLARALTLAQDGCSGRSAFREAIQKRALQLDMENPQDESTHGQRRSEDAGKPEATERKSTRGLSSFRRNHAAWYNTCFV